MRQDPFAQLKQRQREMSASFGPTALFTTPVAGHVVRFAALSIPHFRLFMERSVVPMQKLVENSASDPQKLERFRAEFDVLAAPYHFDNQMHQDYLLTRAQAA